MTESKRDSLRVVLDDLQFKLLNIKDSQREIILNQYESKRLQLERDYNVCTVAYGEAVKNYEIADFALKSQTPFIQVIDRPLVPLKPNNTFNSCLIKSITVFLITILLTVFLISVRKFYWDIIFE